MLISFLDRVFIASKFASRYRWSLSRLRYPVPTTNATRPSLCILPSVHSVYFTENLVYDLRPRWYENDRFSTRFVPRVEPMVVPARYLIHSSTIVSTERWSTIRIFVPRNVTRFVSPFLGANSTVTVPPRFFFLCNRGDVYSPLSAVKILLFRSVKYSVLYSLATDGFARHFESIAIETNARSLERSDAR